MNHPESAAAPRNSPAKTQRSPGERRRAKADRQSLGGDGVRLGESAAGEEAPEGRPATAVRSRPALNLLSLVAATFFVVSGGPYGLEEIVATNGYAQTLVLLLLVPLLWSLPIALLVGELGSSLPKEGGYYAWVRRALGPFWGVQEAWLALAMSLFDMAIYPTLLVTYLGRLFPALQDTSFGAPGWLAGLAMIVVCAWWNIRGSRVVGLLSILMGSALLLPFIGLVMLALMGKGPVSFAGALELLKAAPPSGAHGGKALWLSGLLLCMWNYMGWDNASTVAAEVEQPQRSYPRAMLLTIVLVSLCYVLPVLAATVSGIPPESWNTGTWVEVGGRLGGPVLSLTIAIGGALCGLGMFTVLVMSYSRLPMAMARDGLLPRWIGWQDPRSGAPTRAIVIAAALYAACMGLGFRRLVEIDVLLYGAVLSLEFISLVVLRIREPNLHRPFRIPGGIPVIILMGMLPLGLLLTALWAQRDESAGFWGITSLQFGALVIFLGPLLFAAQHFLSRRKRAQLPRESV